MLRFTNELAPLEATGRPLQRLLHGHPRRGHRARCGPLDRSRAADVTRGPAVGRQRLHAHVRRTTAPGWAHGGSAWTPAAVPGRPGPVHAGLAAVWARAFRERADRVPCDPGVGRRRDDA